LPACFAKFLSATNEVAQNNHHLRQEQNYYLRLLLYHYYYYYVEHTHNDSLQPTSTTTVASLQDTSRPAKGKRGTEKEKGEENQQ
jgi:hypothetical protein